MIKENHELYNDSKLTSHAAGEGEKEKGEESISNSSKTRKLK